jgi:sporulation protein YlmC with PRC-barrel domain
MPSTMPSTTGSTPSSTGAAVLIDRQKTGEALSSELVGAAVYAATGERVGDVNDLVIDGSGRVSGVVIGVGGFLGMGEKNVAVDYASVMKSEDDSGRARLTVNLTKDALKTAAPFVPVKKS